MLSYTIRLSVTRKEYKKVPLAQRKIAPLLETLTIHKVHLLDCGQGTADQLPLLLRIMVFLEVEMQGSTLIPPNQLARSSSQGRDPSLNGKLRHQKVIQ